MKLWIVCIGIVVSLTGFSFAQKMPKAEVLASHLDRIYAQAQTKQIKPYYANRQAAEACEAWRSCARWAFEEYAKDVAFKVVKAELKTQHRIYRHCFSQKTHLFVEATYAHRTVYLEFITPSIDRHTRSYNYIVKFPK